MLDQATWLLTEYPWLTHLVGIMVACRIIFKPLFAILGKYVELTVEEDDNKRLQKILDSKWYKLTSFTIDLLVSVKLPKIKRK